MQKVMAKRYDFSSNKFTKMLRFLSVVEAYGLIYPGPSGKNSSFALLCKVSEQGWVRTQDCVWKNKMKEE